MKENLNSFLHHMRDMETALMQVFPHFPVKDLYLAEEVFNVVYSHIRDLNPFIELKEKPVSKEKFFDYGSLRISTRIK